MLPEQQYTVKEAAKILNCNERIVRNLCITGEINAFKLGASWRISPKNLNLFIETKHKKSGVKRK